MNTGSTMKTAANFWSFYSTVIAVVFQVKQCGITRDQRNAKKEIGRKKKRPPWTTHPPISKDHLCSEQIQQVWQFSHVELHWCLYLRFCPGFSSDTTERRQSDGDKFGWKNKLASQMQTGHFLTCVFPRECLFVWLFINKKLQVLQKAIWGLNPFGQRGTL